MQRPDPTRPRLVAIAEALGDLRKQFVFVGGSTDGLLLTNPLAAGPGGGRQLAVDQQVGHFLEEGTDSRLPAARPV